MEEAPENGKESSYSAHANGMYEYGFFKHCIESVYEAL
jgi:hypothetical protein